MSEVFVIAQGGGPTAVINQTVAGAVLEARTPDRRVNPGARGSGMTGEHVEPRPEVVGAQHAVHVEDDRAGAGVSHGPGGSGGRCRRPTPGLARSR